MQLVPSSGAKETKFRNLREHFETNNFVSRWFFLVFILMPFAYWMELDKEASYCRAK